MKKVVFVALQHSMATFMNALGVFHQAGVIWNVIAGREATPHFEVSLVTLTGEPLQCVNGVQLIPQGSLHDGGNADVIVIAPSIDIAQSLAIEHEVIPWLRERYAEGAHVASICSGAFFLAEAGLLDGKSATTHWCHAEDFRRRYPRVRLRPELLIVDEGDIFCAGGALAGMDLSLYLVEKYCGPQVALELKKVIVYDAGRTSQLPYAVFRRQKDHNDEKVLAVQEWIEQNHHLNFNYGELAARHGMSLRTLERRFKAAVGESPLTYQQRVRVEKARQMLETGEDSFDEITCHVGYEDSSSFRKVFLREVGLLPAEYRKRFQSIGSLYHQSVHDELAAGNE